MRISAKWTLIPLWCLSLAGPVVAAMESTAGPESTTCSLAGGPAVAYVRRTEFGTQYSNGNDVIVADNAGSCEIVVHNSSDPEDGAGLLDVRALAFNYIRNDSGGGIGNLIWVLQGTCSGGRGLQHATFEVNESGSIITTLPLETEALCMPVAANASLWYPSISPFGDRIAFFVNAPPKDGGTWLAVANAMDGKSVANGIDMNSTQKVTDIASLIRQSAWSPSGNTIYYNGILPEDQSGSYGYIYVLTEADSSWSSKKLVRADYQGLNGPERRFRAPSAALWNYDGSGKREVLAFTVLVGEHRSNPPESIEIIDVATYDFLNPSNIASIGGGYAYPRFTSIVSEGTEPNLFVLDDNGLDPFVVEIDPATGICVADDNCVSLGSTGSILARPASAIESEPVPNQHDNSGVLSVIIDLLMGDDVESNE